MLPIEGFYCKNSTIKKFRLLLAVLPFSFSLSDSSEKCSCLGEVILNLEDVAISKSNTRKVIACSIKEHNGR